MRLIFIHFSCRIAPCQLHTNQKEKREEQHTDSLFVWPQKVDVEWLLAEEVLAVKSFLYKKLHYYDICFLSRSVSQKQILQKLDQKYFLEGSYLMLLFYLFLHKNLLVLYQKKHLYELLIEIKLKEEFYILLRVLK